MPSPPHTFPRTHRLRSKIDFSKVFDARMRESRGPITIYALPNNLNHPRMGISIGRAVGTAPRRNRIKRLLRESFRLMQHDFPRGYDLVITVRPHVPFILAEYQKIMSGAMVKLHQAWERRGGTTDEHR
ncbi:MAG TPA: ribonuclease P protein component [Tepidisphaeraceae bacterium]|jgi:ribonuclease P protein component|nr:ribonuclease P protein component [Tepidisphaeraceae bacterium]